LIKGTSAMLGASVLAERCAELERLSRGGSVPDAASRRLLEAELKAMT